MGVIYMLTSPSNKKYIGQHNTENVEKRLKSHVAGYEAYIKKLEELTKLREENPTENFEDITNKGCVALYNAFAKHGPENFEYEILFEQIPLEELNGLEDDCIIKYNTLAPNGYNLRLNNGKERPTLSEESRKRFSEAAF